MDTHHARIASDAAGLNDGERWDILDAGDVAFEGLSRPGSDAGPRPSDAPRQAKDSGAQIRTILLASDLTSASANAEDLAFELASRLDGTLLLVSVIDPRGLWLPTGGYRQRIDQAREARQIAAKGIMERGRHEGVSIRTLIWDGDPAEAIVEAAIAEDVDIIVVGSHQRRGVDRLVMGSVSEQVVRTSPVPVVVARHTAR